MSLRSHLLTLAITWAELSARLVESGLMVPFAAQEMPLVPVLARMELNGVGFDADWLSSTIAALKRHQDDLISQAHALAGREFLVSSAKELSIVLYNELKLPVPGREKAYRVDQPTKELHPSTDDKALTQLLPLHKLPNVIRMFRRVSKLLNTYVTPFADHAVPASLPPLFAFREAHRRVEDADHGEDVDDRGVAVCADGVDARGHARRLPVVPWSLSLPRIHTQMHQTSTATGRLSSRYPNLQNLPSESRDAHVADDALDGVKVRSAFRPSSARTQFMAVDYSQIEMRILAHFCGDDTLVRVFHEAAGGRRAVERTASAPSTPPEHHARLGDIYVQMAMRVFRKRAEEVTPTERQMAKTVCLGIIYGLGHREAAQKLDISEEAAAQVKRDFLRTFPGIRAFMSGTQSFAKESELVLTLANRRRLLQHINSEHSGARSQAERQAVNSMIQGTARCVRRVGQGTPGVWRGTVGGEARNGERRRAGTATRREQTVQRCGGHSHNTVWKHSGAFAKKHEERMRCPPAPPHRGTTITTNNSSPSSSLVLPPLAFDPAFLLSLSALRVRWILRWMQRLDEDVDAHPRPQAGSCAGRVLRSTGRGSEPRAPGSASPPRHPRSPSRPWRRRVRGL